MIARVLIPSLALVAVLLLTACESRNESAGQAHDHATPPAVVQDTTRKSIPRETHAQIGTAHLTIKYHAPAVRGRTIWGGLVPYGEVWVTGAHNATSVETSAALTIAGKELPAGRYAFFTVPGKENWTIIFNRNWDQHLADEYDAKDDVVAIEVQPEVSPKTQERLNYSIIQRSESAGAISLAWERVRVSVPFEIR